MRGGSSAGVPSPPSERLGRRNPPVPPPFASPAPPPAGVPCQIDVIADACRTRHRICLVADTGEIRGTRNWNEPDGEKKQSRTSGGNCANSATWMPNDWSHGPGTTCEPAPQKG